MNPNFINLYLIAMLLAFRWFHLWFIVSSFLWIRAASSRLAPPELPSSICFRIFLPVAVKARKFSLSVSISNCRSWKKQINKIRYLLWKNHWSNILYTIEHKYIESQWRVCNFFSVTRNTTEQCGICSEWPKHVEPMTYQQEKSIGFGIYICLVYLQRRLT